MIFPFKYYLHQFSFFSIPRIWNSIVLRISYFLSNYSKRIIVWGLPEAISIETTTKCNLSCPLCISGTNSFTRETGSLSFSNFNKIFLNIPKQIQHINLYFQGESFLNKNIFLFIESAANKNISTTISTNGNFSDPEIIKNIAKSELSHLIISLDGASAESYKKYRIGGDFNTVLNFVTQINVEKERLNKSTPFVEIQFLLFKHNEHEIKDFEILAKKIKVDKVTFKTAQLNNIDDFHKYNPKQLRNSRYKQINKKLVRKGKVKNSCWRMWHSCVITWDGNVIPCCFDKDAKFVFGNVKDESLQKIWRNNIYQKFRKNIFSDRKSIAMCQNCTQGIMYIK